MEIDKDQQELMFKLQMFEQQIQGLQQQMQAVEKATVELESLKVGLDELKGKKDQEIMASVGRGIFVKAKLLSEDLTVDIGGRNFVKKSIPDTQKTIEEQVNKLQEAKNDLEKAMEEVNKQLTSTMMAHQENKK